MPIPKRRPGSVTSARTRIKAHLVDHADTWYPRWLIQVLFRLLRLEAE